MNKICKSCKTEKCNLCFVMPCCWCCGEFFISIIWWKIACTQNEMRWLCCCCWNQRNIWLKRLIDRIFFSWIYFYLLMSKSNLSNFWRLIICIIFIVRIIEFTVCFNHWWYRRVRHVLIRKEKFFPLINKMKRWKRDNFALVGNTYHITQLLPIWIPPFASCLS